MVSDVQTIGYIMLIIVALTTTLVTALTNNSWESAPMTNVTVYDDVVNATTPSPNVNTTINLATVTDLTQTSVVTSSVPHANQPLSDLNISSSNYDGVVDNVTVFLSLTVTPFHLPVNTTLSPSPATSLRPGSHPQPSGPSHPWTLQCGPKALESALYLSVFAVALLATLSVLLNTLAIIIYRSRDIRQYAFARYLVVIAAADGLILVFSLASRWLTILDYMTAPNSWTPPYDGNVVVCKTFTFMLYVCRFVSHWTSVALCRERLIVVSVPHRISDYQMPGFATRICGVVAVAAVVINLPVLVTWSPRTETSVIAEHACLPTGNDVITGIQVHIGMTMVVVVFPTISVVLYVVFLVKNLRGWKLQRRRLCSNALVRMRLERQATVMVLSNMYCYCACALPCIFIQSFLFTWELTHAHWTVCEHHTMEVVMYSSDTLYMVAYTFKFFASILTGKFVLDT